MSPDAHDSLVGGKPDFIVAGRLQSGDGNPLTVDAGNFSDPDAIEICVGNLQRAPVQRDNLTASLGLECLQLGVFLHPEDFSQQNHAGDNPEDPARVSDRIRQCRQRSILARRGRYGRDRLLRSPKRRSVGGGSGKQSSRLERAVAEKRNRKSRQAQPLQ